MASASGDGGRHRIVIIGSGFGGLFAAKELRRADAEVTLVSNTGHHLFQPLLYQVATGILSTGEIAPATREILRHQRNATVLYGEATGIDVERRAVSVQVAGMFGYELPYDSLIVAAGAGQSWFGNDRFEEFAPGTKTIDHALELRGRIFGAFELAEADPESDKADMMALDRLPGVAQVAIQGGTHAARTIGRRLQGRPPPGPFRYFDKGNMATISRFQALTQMGRLEFGGFVAWLAWLVVHLSYLVGFKNRFTTFVHWVVSFIGRGRPERTVTVQQIGARQALQRLAEIEAIDTTGATLAVPSAIGGGEHGAPASTSTGPGQPLSG